MTAPMTPAEINLALATEIERSNPEIFEIETEGQWHDGRVDFAVTDDPSKAFPTRLRLGFSPATDLNHLRLYVLPEIERRGLWYGFCLRLSELTMDLVTPHQGTDYLSAWQCGIRCALFVVPPSTLAMAALDVMRGHCYKLWA